MTCNRMKKKPRRLWTWLDISVKIIFPNIDEIILSIWEIIDPSNVKFSYFDTKILNMTFNFFTVNKLFSLKLKKKTCNDLKNDSQMEQSQETGEDEGKGPYLLP